MKHIKEIIEYKDMIISFVRRELRGKYAKSVLGFLWSFLGPLFQIIIYALVFTYVIPNALPHHYIFLMSGILPWTFFADSLSSGAVNIVQNGEMVKKIYFPREVLPIAEVTAKLINLMLSFVVMFGFVALSGMGFSACFLMLPVVMIIEYIMALGMAFLVSSITVYLQDLEYVISVVLMAWMWGTPILYAFRNIRPEYQRILKLNPMTGIITSYQDILYYHTMPSMETLAIAFVEAVAVLIIGYLVFGKLSRHFVEEM